MWVYIETSDTQGFVRKKQEWSKREAHPLGLWEGNAQSLSHPVMVFCYRGLGNDYNSMYRPLPQSPLMLYTGCHTPVLDSLRIPSLLCANVHLLSPSRLTWLLQPHGRWREPQKEVRTGPRFMQGLSSCRTMRNFLINFSVFSSLQ